MPLTILNNIAAIAAENQLNVTSNSLNSALEQLSSGSRINSGADDPAGLAIANGLEANISALTQSASNATDGVGELQVADGALSQVTTLLDRAVTLATESATGTVSNSQRTAIDTEYQSIKAEIDGIGSTTNFNGGQVFTANTLNVFLSDGSTSGSSTIGVTTGLLSSAGLSLGGATAATGTLTEAAGAAATVATSSLAATGTLVGSTVSTNLLTITATPTATDEVTINGEQYTFVAAANVNAAAGNVAIATGGTAAQNLTQTIVNLAAAINGTPGGAGTAYASGTPINTAVTAAAGVLDTLTITAKLNGTAGNGVTATATGGGNYVWGGATTAVNGNTVTVGGQTYQFVAALSNTPTKNEVFLGASNQAALADLALAVNQGTGAGTDYGTGTVQNANVTAGVVTGAADTAALAFSANVAGGAGDFINGNISANGTFAAFTGGNNAGTAPIAAAGDTVAVGGQTYTFVNALSTTPVQNQVLVEATDAASLTNLANAVNGGTGLGATYSSNTVANTNVTAATGATAAGLSTVTFSAITKGLAGNGVPSTSTTLGGTNANTFANAELTGGAAGSINDLLTQSDAQTALTLINNAVATVAALRGNIGSTVNRLQSASSVINNQTQNLTSAENDVTAADIPTVVANLSSYSILEQTGISAIAQANQQQQLVLKLLT
ncbi:MAG: flagellin [Terriglobales bacterium]|jgi:flagellin